MEAVSGPTQVVGFWVRGAIGSEDGCDLSVLPVHAFLMPASFFSAIAGIGLVSQKISFSPGLNRMKSLKCSPGTPQKIGA